MLCRALPPWRLPCSAGRRRHRTTGPHSAGPVATGVTASVISLALAQLGRDDVPLYDGSWAEWGADAHTPVATGPAE